MEEKKEKITLRLTENQFNQLKREAEENSMTVSDYARGRLLDYPNDFPGDSGKRGHESSQISPKVIVKVSKELIRMEHVLEQLRGAKKEQVAELEERIDKIWHILN